MKNFFKKLSFVLAIAMVLTSVVPATTASAASKVQIELNGKAVTEVTAFFGGVVRNLDASKNGKAASGTWKVGNTKVATVDSKTGVITPVGEGTTKVAFTLKGEKKASASVYVKVRTRAAALHVYDKSEYAVTGSTTPRLEDTTIEMNAGEEKDLRLTMPISKKVSNAGGKISTYFVYGDSSDEDVVKVSVSNKMYTREATLKAVAAGEATVTLFANQTTKANARANKYVKEAKFTVKVSGADATLKSAKASKVNEITIEFAGALPDDAVITVAKGTSNVTGVFKMDETKTVATFTTDANMTNGTYTVSVKIGDKTQTADFDVTDQRVDQIVIKNDVALTGKRNNKEAMEAYVYYTVLDQYEQDITETTSIRWTTSTGNVSNSTKGKLVIWRSDDKAFTYGESLFVNGVYEKSGKSVQKTLTIGMEQQPNTIQMVGFVKKGTTEVLQKLPKRFTANTYYLIFNVLDQNGDKMEAAPAYSSSTYVNFISHKILLVEGIEFDANTGVLNIGEKAYNTAWVKPGMNVGEGGEFTLEAISSKTGKTESATFAVENNQVLKSFEIGTIKSGVLANGDTGVEYNFKALDEDGQEITKFTVLHNNKNTLKVTGSNVTVDIAQTAADGIKVTVSTAHGGVNFTAGDDLDGIDVPANISTVVIGGEAKTTMLYISDARRPVGVKETAIKDYYVERDVIKVVDRQDSIYDKGRTKTSVAAGAKIVYVDQYGVAMSEASAESFLGKTLNGSTEFSGYKYILGFELVGSNVGRLLVSEQDKRQNYLGTGVAHAVTGSAVYGSLDGNTQLDIYLRGDGVSGTNVADNTIKFALYRIKGTDFERVSTEKVKTFGVIDIDKVENISAVEGNKVLTSSDASGYITLPETYSTNAAAKLNDTAVDTNEQNEGQKNINNNNGLYEAGSIVVTGTYKKTTVDIPDIYVKARGAYMAGENCLLDDVILNIKYSDLYDVKSTNYAKTELKDTLNVWVVSEGAITSGTTDAERALLSKASCSCVIGIYDSPLAIAKVNGKTDTMTVTGAFDVATLSFYNESGLAAKDLLATTDKTAMTSSLFDSLVLTDGREGYVYKDGNGDLSVVAKNDSNVTAIGAYTFLFNASDVVEADGLATGSVKISNQNSEGLYIDGLESGDTFKLTTTVMAGGKVVTTWTTNVTVLFDITADIDNTYDKNAGTITGKSANWFYTIINNAK